MNRRRQRLATTTVEIIDTALLACLVAGVLVGVVAAVTLLRTLQMGPPVGEILRFGPYPEATPLWRIDAVRSADHRHCILQPAVMEKAHGSVVVEQRFADGRTFLVHWEGGPTSDGAANCGSAMDLILGLPEMQTLVNADAAGRHFFLGF